MNPMDVVTIFGAIVVFLIAAVSVGALAFIHRMNKKYGDLPTPSNPTK
ncbi:hypothetical protein QFZ22_003770 [Streptomyces canus]|uniref:Uncharacterized protein n=1 Tax=Streptomyces canus TaxID=58343 RepID=A0AAW8FEU1_9ACTN|nr:hypothetical protein [Streptomyces canus]